MASKTIVFMTKEHLDTLYTKPKDSLRGYGAGGNVHIYKINPEYETSHLHEHRHKRLAVKTIKEENSRGANREIGILEQFTHEPYIVTMLGYERYPFLIFLECCNIDLATFTKRRHFNLNQMEVFKISKDILFGLKPLSKRGIIHRDIKPHNILIDYQGSDGSKVQDTKMKICDFGCSRVVNVERMIDVTKNLGTVGFMAPEISPLLGDDDYVGKYTIQVDMWSFGATILWLVSGGKKPFDTEYLRELHFEVKTNKRRDADIHAKIREYVKDEKICSLLVEVLKWNPDERNTVDETIGLIKHLEKSISTLEKKTGSRHIEIAKPSLQPHKTEYEDYPGDVKLLPVKEEDFDPIIEHQKMVEEKAKLVAERICNQLTKKEISLESNARKGYEPVWKRLYENLKIWKREEKENATIKKLQETLRDLHIPITIELLKTETGRLGESQKVTDEVNVVNFIPMLKHVLEMEERAKIEQVAEVLLKSDINEKVSNRERKIPSNYEKPSWQLLQNILCVWSERSDATVEILLDALTVPSMTHMRPGKRICALEKERICALEGAYAFP